MPHVAAGLDPEKHLGKSLAQLEPHLHRLARCMSGFRAHFKVTAPAQCSCKLGVQYCLDIEPAAWSWSIAALLLNAACGV